VSEARLLDDFTWPARERSVPIAPLGGERIAAVLPDDTSAPLALVGRDPELEAIGRWLATERPSLLQIEGEAGIGKTALWETATRAGREAGARVLTCRPVEVETGVAYSGLASLLEPVLADVRDELPPPRLRALEGALRLRDVTGSRLDETAVALGTLSALRTAAARQPVVVAVDDVQWLDGSSRVAITYALRNLRPGDDVLALLACRLPGAGLLELAGADLATRAERLQLGLLSIGAVHRLVTSRLGASLSRPKLMRVHAASRGNPLHALELARVLAGTTTGSPATIPDSLADVLRARVEGAPQRTRVLLLLVAAAGDPRASHLERLTDDSGAEQALEDALRRDLLLVAEGRVRFSHPLLASTVYGDANELERRRVHLRLAAAAAAPEERARHLALADDTPDEAVAAELARAGAAACRQGARSAGAALYEQSAGLTPAGDEEARAHRLIAAADAHFEAGEPDRARALLEEAASGAGPSRFVALCHLGRQLDETVGGDAALAAFREALETDDAAVATQAHRGLAQALTYVGSAERALEHADTAVAIAEPLADRVALVYALAMQAFVRKMTGHPGWRASLDRALALEAEVDLPDLDASPSAFDADTRRLILELDEARRAYERMLVRAGERDDVPTEAWCRFGLASLEIAAGNWERAAEHGDELSDLADQAAVLRLPALRTKAHLATVRGDVAAARAHLDAIVERAEPAGEFHNLRAGLHLRGLLELSLGDAAAAIPPLERARQIAERMAIREPGILTFLVDEVEARAGVGDADAAASALGAFEACVSEGDFPWVAPLVARARGLVAAARGDLVEARTQLDAAVAGESAIPMPLERARARLALGRVLRRAQQRSEAQAVLEHAVARFDELGAALWAESARAELARIGGRAPSGDDLTPTEQRIAELVASGMTNREVAAALFVTPKTVESTLTRIYRKLGVRSRTELARRLADQD
jgi:DNA-binding CsgD family transcriptional regulator